MSEYDSLGEMIVDMAEVLRPPERLTVSSAAEKYRFINNPGAYVGPWKNETTPYMVEPADLLTDRSVNGIVFVGGAQLGKALAIDTPIPTPTGWTTMGDVNTGEWVIGADGKPCQVTLATEFMYGHECFKVTFDDGETIVADADHKWLVEDAHRNGPRVMTTAEMFPEHKFGAKRRNRFAVRNTQPLELDNVPLPIEPYTLGLWLGDGHSRTARVYKSESDLQEIIEHVWNDLYKASISVDAKGLGVMLIDPAENLGPHNGSNGFIKKLRDCGLLKAYGGRKHIPSAYLRASKEQRIDLLRGLMDTDGTCGKKGQCSFTTTSPEIAESFVELVQSLGFKCQVRTKTPKCTYKGEVVIGKEATTVYFIPYSDFRVFNLSRKQARVRPRSVGRPTHTERRMIVSIEPTESVPVKCIQVNNADHLYLCGKHMVPTHNTDALIINPILYSAVCDPMDMIVYQTSQTMARDFSIRRVDRLIRHTTEMRKRLLPGNGDNVFDKKMVNGMLLTLSWPTINELSGRPVGRVVLTDYDRMPQDVDGEGSPFDLGRKRTTTFGSAAKTVAESSPGFEVQDTNWVRQSPHQAPPCPGIMSLYNRGDRRRWYWKCPHCRAWFEPEFSLLKWPDSMDVMECAEQAQMMCPHCAALIPSTFKYELNQTARWVRDGQQLTRDDALVGVAARSDIASFWIKGPAATFASWKDLVSRYLLAEQEFQRTGSQEALKSTVNTDQGEPYVPRGLDRLRTPDELKVRSVEVPQHDVPDDVRFLIATADVQKSKFVVQVFGVGPGAADEPYRLTVVDRFDIVKSKRIDDDGERWPVRPAKYLEDWDMLTEQVLDKAYPLADGTGHMRVSRVAVDSGGREGVTTNAYDFWRALRKRGAGEHQRVHLVKGDGLPNNPRVRVSFPDAVKKDKKAPARGDVPVLIFNVNLIKDELNNRMERALDDGAAFVWPSWLPDEWFSEMCAEHRTAKGWENPRKARNEAWDLAVYAIGVCLHIKIDRLNWDAPNLDMARDRPENPYFIPLPKPGADPVAPKEKGRYGLGKLAEVLA